MFVFDVNNQTLTKTDGFTPATDSVGYLTAKFNFKTEDWTDTVKTAIFKSRNGVKSRSLVNDECEIPAELIARNGSGYIHLTISVVGTRPDGYRIPTDEKTIRFNNSGFVEGLILEDAPSDQSAQIEALKSEVAELQKQNEELTTENNNLENENATLSARVEELESAPDEIISQLETLIDESGVLV